MKLFILVRLFRKQQQQKIQIGRKIKVKPADCFEAISRPQTQPVFYLHGSLIGFLVVIPLNWIKFFLNFCGQILEFVESTMSGKASQLSFNIKSNQSPD